MLVVTGFDDDDDDEDGTINPPFVVANPLGVAAGLTVNAVTSPRDAAAAPMTAIIVAVPNFIFFFWIFFFSPLSLEGFLVVYCGVDFVLTVVTI